MGPDTPDLGIPKGSNLLIVINVKLVLNLSFGRTRAAIAAVGASILMGAMVSAAAAAPNNATDSFTGTAVLPAGQTSPIAINPNDVTLRADRAIGLGYTYRASGQATGQLPGSFTYEEHGYLYFTNPADPATLVGSRYSSAAFSLSPARGTRPLVIADTAPERYTSGVQTLVGKLGPEAARVIGGLGARPQPLTYGFFTFTDAEGTFTGYATPDFTRFKISVTFSTTP